MDSARSALLFAVASATAAAVASGCVSAPRVSSPLEASAPQPTSAPSSDATAVGNVATSVASTIEARVADVFKGIEAQIDTRVEARIADTIQGIGVDTTIDHALDGGTLLVLLLVVFLSHRREVHRIKRNGGARCTSTS